MHILFAYAAPLEAGPLPDEPDIAVHAEFAQVGIGKAASACHLLSRLAVDPQPDLVVSFGVCGAHPSGPAVGELCLVGTDCLADEGVRTETGFLGLDELGLDATLEFAMDRRRTTEAAAMLGGLPIVRGTTVSTCAAQDELARERAARTGAQVETMEGAAVAMACAEQAVPMIQLRCVSNRTGDRERAGWDLERACTNLQAAVRTLMGGIWQA